MDTQAHQHSREVCPGCGCGDTRPVSPAGIQQCDRCGGLLTLKAVTFDVLLRVVRLDVMQDGCPAPQYFDFLYVDRDGDRIVQRRTHGWFDPATKKVVQFG